MVGKQKRLGRTISVKPTTYPNIIFDPKTYDPTRKQTEEETNDAYWKMRDMARNHRFLRRFYENRLPYTEEFDQMYYIVKEEIGK